MTAIQCKKGAKTKGIEMKDWAHNLVYDVIEFKKKEQIDLLIKLIEESEEAKQVLREKGYGWTGLSLLETVQTQVPYND